MESRRKSILSLAVWMLVMTVGSLEAQSNDQAQIEKGRQAVGQVCVACHNNIMRMVQIHKKSAAQWKDTVYSMISRGALILPDEIDPLAAFLASNAGRTQSSGSARQELPESEGKTLLERNCQQCHELDTATQKTASEDWNTVISKMVTYGAKVSPAEQQKLVEYLSGLAK